jgi:hypothetical protein
MSWPGPGGGDRDGNSVVDSLNRVAVCVAMDFRESGSSSRNVEARGMRRDDIAKVIEWFKRRIAVLEYPVRPGTREGLNRLRGFVEVLEGELGERDGA